MQTLDKDAKRIKDGPQLQVRLAEAAEIMGYSKRTIEKLIARGELASVGTGRLRRVAIADLHAWQERNRNEANDGATAEAAR